MTYRVTSVPPTGATLDPTRPNQVRVYVLQVLDDTNPRCARLSASARVAGENADTVFAAAFSYGLPTGQNRPCLYAQADPSPPLDTPLVLQLRAPLGSRTLIDVKTGRPIGIATGQQPPAPSYVPSGYQQSVVQPFDVANGFVAIRQFLSGRRTIEISVRSATAWDLTGKVTGHARIAGHAATVTDESYERCLTWSDDQSLIREVCSLNGHGFLSARELERIAASLSS